MNYGWGIMKYSKRELLIIRQRMRNSRNGKFNFCRRINKFLNFKNDDCN